MDNPTCDWCGGDELPLVYVVAESERGSVKAAGGAAESYLGRPPALGWDHVCTECAAEVPEEYRF